VPPVRGLEEVGALVLRRDRDVQAGAGAVLGALEVPGLLPLGPLEQSFAPVAEPGRLGGPLFAAVEEPGGQGRLLLGLPGAGTSRREWL
jgi:hypothetical protein